MAKKRSQSYDLSLSVKKVVFHLGGVGIFALGVAMLKGIGFGASPIGAASYNLSSLTGWSLGLSSNIMSAIIIFIAIILAVNNKNRLIYLGAFATSLYYGIVLELFDNMLPAMKFSNQFFQILAFTGVALFMWIGTPFYYFTGYPKLFGTSLIHSMKTKWKKLTNIQCVLVIEGSLTLLAIGFALLDDKTLGNVGLGTVISVFAGSIALGYWMKLLGPKVQKWLKKDS